MRPGHRAHISKLFLYAKFQDLTPLTLSAYRRIATAAHIRLIFAFFAAIILSRHLL